MGGLSDGVLFEQRPEGGEGANCEAVWGKRILGSVSNKCKGPELRTCLECSRNTTMSHTFL